MKSFLDWLIDLHPLWHYAIGAALGALIYYGLSL